MKSNSFVKFVLIVLSFFCLFQFASLIPTNKVETKAAKVASSLVQELSPELQDSMYQVYYQDYISKAADEVLFSIPFVKEYTYQSLKNQQLQLGLDLRGGMQFTLNIDSENFLKQFMESNTDPLFVKALAKTNEQGELSHPYYIDAFFENYQTLTSSENIVLQFSRNEQIKNGSYETQSLAQVQQRIHSLSKSAIEDLRFLLNQRLNATGLSQSQINLNFDNHNIQIEIPGAKNPERIRELITRTAALEFWNVYRVNDSEILERLVAADRAIQLQSK